MNNMLYNIACCGKSYKATRKQAEDIVATVKTCGLKGVNVHVLDSQSKNVLNDLKKWLELERDKKHFIHNVRPTKKVIRVNRLLNKIEELEKIYE